MKRLIVIVLSFWMLGCSSNQDSCGVPSNFIINQMEQANKVAQNRSM